MNLPPNRRDDTELGIDGFGANNPHRDSAWAIFLVFLRLGLTCFGGPVAHIGYFRQEFVERRRWLGDRAYADLVALCQFLPGPASSQVGIALGSFRAGVPGAIAAWLGFTLPSAVALVLFALALTEWAGGADGAWLHGLKVVAVAVVAQALWGMARSLCPDWPRATLAVLAAIAVSLVPGPLAQLAVIVAGGLIGIAGLRSEATLAHAPFPVPWGRRRGVSILLVLAVLLLLLPVIAAASGSPAMQVFDALFRTGALVFGGGHVVLPLLQAETVATGWVGQDAFLAGYGAAQAVPGPLFSFAAYLGAIALPDPWLGAVLALVAIFLPSFLLVFGALPLWEAARRHPRMQQAMLGINAAVVGLLLAAFHDPVWTSAILSWADFLLALVALLLLQFARWPSWLVVAGCAVVAGLGGNA